MEAVTGPTGDPAGTLILGPTVPAASPLIRTVEAVALPVQTVQ
jgi:hypothetical protein